MKVICWRVAVVTLAEFQGFRRFKGECNAYATALPLPPPLDLLPAASVVVSYATYRLVSPTASTWLAAQQACVGLGGHLASFASAAELTAVRDALVAALAAYSPPYTTSWAPLWIGLYERSLSYGEDWRWSDRSPLTFSGFGQYELNAASNPPTTPNCGALHLDRAGQWSVQGCGTQLQYLCKLANVANAPPPSPPPAAPATARQLAFRFAVGDLTYTLVMQPRSYAAANRYCGSLDPGGTLAVPADARVGVACVSRGVVLGGGMELLLVWAMGLWRAGEEVTGGGPGPRAMREGRGGRVHAARG